MPPRDRPSTNHSTSYLGFDGKRKTSVTSGEMTGVVLDKVARLTEGTTLRVGLPFGIGCGLAGGDWSVVSRMIEEHLPQAVLYRL